MRTHSAVLTLALCTLLAACGGREVAVESTPAAATALEPVGTYDFTVSLGGQTRDGVIQITRDADGYGGVATLEGESEAATVEDVRIEGSRMTVDVATPGEALTFEMNFTGSSFTGFAFGGGDAIPLTGSRRTP